MITFIILCDSLNFTFDVKLYFEANSHFCAFILKNEFEKQSWKIKRNFFSLQLVADFFAVFPETLIAFRVAPVNKKNMNKMHVAARCFTLMLKFMIIIIAKQENLELNFRSIFLKTMTLPFFTIN